MLNWFQMGVSLQLVAVSSTCVFIQRPGVKGSGRKATLLWEHNLNSACIMTTLIQWLQQVRWPNLELRSHSAYHEAKKKHMAKSSTFYPKGEQKRINIFWIIQTIIKILKELGIPDHLTGLLINLYAGQEAATRTGHGIMDWFQIGRVCQGSILSPCLFNLNAEYIRRNADMDEAQAGIKIARRNINNLRYADGITLITESKEELKSLLKKKWNKRVKRMA